MEDVKVLNKRVRAQLRRLGVKLPRGEPDVSRVARKWHPLDYICSWYEGQDGEHAINVKALGGMWLMRHEYGHYLVEKYDLAKQKSYKNTFKNGPLYAEGLGYDVGVVFLRATDVVLRKGAKISPPKGHPTFYALLGGEECFCECVALLLSNRCDYRKAADGDMWLENRLIITRLLLEQHCR